jgi:uncharacterized protein (TIGR02996 family)
MFSEADAFLDAIFAQPADDTARLVYADWLQEHGQELYARFIRLSCQVARREIMPPDVRSRLRRERYEAFRALVQWYPAAFDDLNLQVSSFNRGILDRGLQLPETVFIRTSPYWWPVIHPRTLSLLGCMYGYTLPRCVYLAHVDALECLGCPPRWGRSNTGLVTDEYDPISSELLRGLADGRATPRLKSLSVRPIWMTGTDLQAFGESALAEQLERLWLIVATADDGEEELDASWQPRPGRVKTAITDFLAEYGDQLPREREPPRW